MSKKDNELSQVSEFVLQANKICQEFFGPGGADPDQDVYEYEVDLYNDITRWIQQENIQELKNLQADYLAILQADDEEEDRYKIINQRLLDASGLDIKGVENIMVNEASKIIACNHIASKEEYYALYRYFDYLKDKGRSFDEVIKVEELLARFSSTYDHL